MRHCACCGNPLPPPSATQKKPRKYCPDGAGGYEERFGITCGELGPAKEKYERVFGRDAVPGADLEILGEQVAAAGRLLGPDSPLATLLGGLTGTLTGVGDRLDGTVADALAEAARATAAEAEALGRERAALIERDAANEQAQQAVLDRQAAVRERDTKVRAAENRAEEAEKAQRAAELARGKAETERDAHRGRAERADQAARIARRQTTVLTRANTALKTLVEQLTTQLRAAQEQAEQERGRADRAVADAETARAEARDQIDAAHVAAAETAATARQQAEQQITGARAELDRRTGEHTRTVQELTEKAATATAELTAFQRRVRDGLARLQRRRDAEPGSEDAAEQDPGQQLRQAVTAHTELRHAVEDLARELELD